MLPWSPRPGHQLVNTLADVDISMDGGGPASLESNDAVHVNHPYADKMRAAGAGNHVYRRITVVVGSRGSDRYADTKSRSRQGL